MAEVQPVRGCDSCGQVDDHPRHTHGTVNVNPDLDFTTHPEVAVRLIDNAPDEAKAAVMAHIQDRTTQMKHMDCCRADGCPDGSCNRVTAGAEDLKGDKLRKHLTKGS